ncbi:MAG: TIGR03067 domain-containing protein [Planctomycetes bacterium]|nr:TIGR03067 domain-containing protein [Planctomycetota bacterium]
MKTLGLASFAAVLFVALHAHAGDDAQKKDKAALQGVWKIVKFETPKGQDDNIVNATLEFDKEGKNIIFTRGDESKKGTFKINAAGKPKEIDISPTDENKTFEGIYEIKDKTLKICLCPDGSEGRPTEFAVKDGKKYVLITLEKTK